MQANMHKIEGTSRYSSSDVSSHSNFTGGSAGMFRNNGGQHNESASRGIGPNPSYGAQFNPNGLETNDNGNIESPYAAWQNINSSSSSSWNANEGKPSVGRGILGNRGDGTAKEESMMIDQDGNSFSGLIGATGGSENFSDDKSGQSNFNGGNASRAQQVPRLGLLGGGESSLVAPSSNWSGSQGPSSAVGAWGSRQNGSSEMNVNSSAGTPTKPQGSWAQAAGKGLGPALPNSCPGGTVAASEIPSPLDNSSTNPPNRDQEPVSDIRVKAAYSQGWGQESVNQDTPWAVDDSSDSSKEGSSTWRSSVNNGTEIWETHLRMGKGGNVPGPPAPAPVSTAPPWGHTPATNIGGHWGDDEPQGTWTGVAPPSSGSGSTSNWSESSGNAGNMWGSSNPTDKHWNSNQTQWAGEGNNSDNSWNARNRQLGSWSPVSTPKKELPPSGWEPPSPPPVRRVVGSGNGGGGSSNNGGGNYDDGTSMWGNPQRQNKVCHWKDMPSAKPIMNASSGIVGPNGMLGNMPPSGPGMIRLPGTGKGDATWNKVPMGRGGSNWQDMPQHRDSPTIGSWNEEQMKSQGGQYGNWNDQSTCWSGRNTKPPSSWADGQVDTSSWLGPAKQRNEMMHQEEIFEKKYLKNDSEKETFENWADVNARLNGDFAGRKLKGGKPLCKDIVHASKQFRILTEFGFRKEDVENALRNNNMNFEEAAAELQAMNSGAMDLDNFGGRKVRPANMYDDMSLSEHSMDSFNQNNFHSGNSNLQNFSGGHNFKQTSKASNNVMHSTLGNQTLGGNNLNPALIQKLMQQQQMVNLNNMQSMGSHKFTTNTQLKHLVQQIQMAVQAGHLNAQILNQPLASQTLQLLYQLLQQIKGLTGLQHSLQTAHLKQAPASATMQLNVHIAQTKARIANLQNQICAQQAVFLKQPLAQTQQSLHTPSNSMDIFKPPTVDPPVVPGLHSDFRDLSLKDMSSHQSRLNQWKLTSAMDGKDDGPSLNVDGPADFSRAPGPVTSKPPPPLHTLLDQGDTTWGGLSAPRPGESVWPEPPSSLSGDGSAATAQTGDGKESVVAPPAPPSYNLTDLVPEFEPGKPWKGSQMKNVEDDPHITPGSIARSPLSVNSIKDTNLFWPSKGSPAGSNEAANASTWGFGAQAANNSNPNVKSTKTSWSPDFSSDSWNLSKSRNTAPLPSAQGWDRQNNSAFLILKNLTPQIDGSTLKTLCMQHGPLQMFHLFLNRGVALVRYSTREEAAKAQSALDNCVLSNTTMLAEIPSETEVQQYLQSGGQATTASGGGGTNAWPSTPTGGSTTTSYGSSSFYGTANSNWNNAGSSTSQLWSFNNSSLWGSGAQSAAEPEGSTNPINYLPNDLLGGEPI